MVLPEQRGETAVVAAERLRRAVEDLAIPHPGVADRGVVTISAGVAVLGPAEAHDLTGFLKRADAALYEAKAAGRNRVEVATEDSAMPAVTQPG